MNRIFIPIVLLYTLFTSCDKQAQALNKIDIQTLDFNTSPAILFDLAEYKILNNSAITNSEAYYTYDLDTLRFGNTMLASSKLLAKNEDTKVEELSDVFDVNQSVNRIEIYTSKDSLIDAIVLEINNIEQGESLLKDLNIQSLGTHQWVDSTSSKTYLLHSNEWVIDNKKMLTVTLCIIKTEGKTGSRIKGIKLIKTLCIIKTEGKTGEDKLVDLFSDFYR